MEFCSEGVHFFEGVQRISTGVLDVDAVCSLSKFSFLPEIMSTISVSFLTGQLSP